MLNFVIARVIGNDLPPKDVIGGKLKSLRYVVEQDKAVSADKTWILNRIFDKDYLKEIINILEGQTIYEIPFDKKEYKKQLSQLDKTHYLTNINNARNIIVKKGQETYDYIASLDQDCFFFADHWKTIVDYINNDKASKQYYGMISKRLVDITKIWEEPDNEAMLMFRKDADLMFDENIVFGQNDKRELLFKLGYTPGDWKCHKPICSTAGYVMHIGYDEKVEHNGMHRNIERKIALERLVERADKFCNYVLI